MGKSLLFLYILPVEICHTENEKAINENYETHQAEKTSNMKVAERQFVQAEPVPLLSGVFLEQIGIDLASVCI